MQAAAGLVCIVIKFASRMECGEDDPLRADTLLVSDIVAEPSFSSVTRISLHTPARCSSTELSTIS